MGRQQNVEQVSIVGSLANMPVEVKTSSIGVSVPTKLLSIPYTAWVSGLTYNSGPISGLHRNAIKRTVQINNGQDKGITDGLFYLKDSVAGNSYPSGVGTSFSLGSISNNMRILSNEVIATQLASMVDQFTLAFTWGATQPTLGNIEVWVSEMLR